jgi:hypothetical protein
MLLFIDDATRNTDEYILKYKSEALETFKELKPLKEKESGMQVKRFRKAIVEASPCVLILGFHLRSERETKEAGLQRHSWHISWVQHID